MNASAPSPSNPDLIAPRRWRLARHLLLAGAVVATLIAVFYTEENWRGRRAWENCRRQLEARGEKLDWEAYIPAPVPDEQNIFKAPRMREWFVKESLLAMNSSPARPPNTPQPFTAPQRQGTNLIVAEVKVIAPNAPPDSPPPDAVWRFDDPAAPEQAAAFLREFLGPCAIGCRVCVLVARPLDQFPPLHLVLQADPSPTLRELAAFFPSNLLADPMLAYSGTGYWQVAPAGTNAFRLFLKAPVYGAADYLAWTDSMGADFDVVRKALERPNARIDGEYDRPFLIPIPDFVRIRTVAQLLSQRAQCDMLLGQPDAAWRELSLVHDLCRLLRPQPSGQPITLVSAMIYTAVSGLYADMVRDGLRLHAWREPQLLALERQLEETDLLASVVEAFHEEHAAACRTFEATPPVELARLINHPSAGNTWPDKLRDSVSTLALAAIPRGWYYQNMVVGYGLEPGWLGCVDVTNQLVRAGRISETLRRGSRELTPRSPYTFLVAMGLPNYAKALQNTAFNQTRVNQARLACALERYRLAQGKYPESLDALSLRFMQKLPHDLIGGQPFKYRRTGSGGYQLYSVGWNEKDDGGVTAKSREEGDWVWELR